MYDTFRESALGQAIRLVSRNKWLQYPEEKSDFVLPPEYAALLFNSEKQHETTSNRSNSHLNQRSSTPDPASDSSQTADEDGEDLRRERTVGSIQRGPYMEHGRFDPEQQIELKKTKSEPIVPHKTNDGVILVDWYTTDDPANPQNWSSFKRSYIVFVICLYTWVAYVAGSVFAFSEPGIVEHFGVSVEASELGLALYVLAYGVGPFIFGPLTEIPVIGRNPVYYLTFLVFFALSFPAATINSFGGLLAVRFFAGFFGSVGIAIGGASIQDVFTLIYFPYGLGWRAKRLRKLTGDARLQSQSEIDQRHMSGSAVLIAALIRPFEITIKDPSIFFVNLYTALTYAIYFTFFEVFPLVFPPFYGFNLGETGLAFLACEVGSILALILYFAYLHFYIIPDNIKNGFREQEHRLLPAIFGSVVLPIGLFIFAWTARATIHWIVPFIGVTTFVLGQYMVIQGLSSFPPTSTGTPPFGCLTTKNPYFI
ncbi:hypothetical protein THARTR1_10287 [Trichoderma harzianum]|uniref:Major facilitator superfamily (MFS) profile domain-containing protein n=1 Tax=Trichoderma harzianum TaxID=5544 RepID=A0A2K0TTI6_TRIHA|nr:hypothetical protein THARTR1_10287 [Trichoderma harzianum]